MRFTKLDLTMTKKTSKRDLQITFIHQFKRATRTEWPDKFRVCWHFNPESLDYIYEHKDEKFITNGFVLSDGLAKQLPEELRKRYFFPQRGACCFCSLNYRSLSSSTLKKSMILSLKMCSAYRKAVIFRWKPLMSGVNRSSYSKGCFAALFYL